MILFKPRYFFILIMACTAIAGCKKNNAVILPIDNYAASFFTNYGIGTYWIYQDTSGRINDSESVTFAQCGPEVNANYYEQCNLYITSDSISQNIQWSTTRYDTLTTSGLIFDINKSSLSESYIINFNNNNIDYNHNFGTIGEIVEKIDTIQVNQFTFYNALKISYTNPYPMYIVIVPHIGVVERLMPDSGYVLKLTKYHIVS